MTSRFDELQTRWVRGERLSAEDETERLAAAKRDPLAKEELRVYAELERLVSSPSAEPADFALADRVLAEVGVRPQPRLRVVRDGERAAIRERRSWRFYAWPVAAAAVVVLASAAAFRGASSRSQTAGVASQPPPAGAPLRPARAELVLAAGEVWLGGEAASVGQGTLAVGATLKSGLGRGCLTIDPAIDVCFAANTELALESLDPRSIRVRVERGLTVASLSPRRSGERFSLVSPGVSADAVGTVFALKRDGQKTSVLVAEGKVSVQSGNRATLVPAQGVLAVGAGSAEHSSLGRSEEANLRALMAPHELWKTAGLSTLEITGPSSASITLGAVEALPIPLSVFVPKGQLSLHAFDAKTGERRSVELTLSMGERRRLELAGPSEPAPKTAPLATAASLLEQARKELGKGNPAGALGLYRKLEGAFPNSPEATTVLVTVGKLELNAGSAGRALRSFDKYLERGGPLAQEALSGRIRALSELGRVNEEQSAIRRYLARYPDGFDASALRKRLDSN